MALRNKTRAMFTETGEVIQDQSYYPFGMCIGAEKSFNNTDDSPENHYLYNGKGQQMDFELDWYDYGARFYDAELGRWHVVDPLAESFNSWTPYRYVHNNPLCQITCQRFLLPTPTLPLLIQGKRI